MYVKGSCKFREKSGETERGQKGDEREFREEGERSRQNLREMKSGPTDRHKAERGAMRAAGGFETFEME